MENNPKSNNSAIKLPKYNKYAISSLIFGIVGLLLMVIFYVFLISGTDIDLSRGLEWNLIGTILQDGNLQIAIGGLFASILGIILGVIGKRSLKGNIARTSLIFSWFAFTLLLIGLLSYGIVNVNKSYGG